MRLLPLAALAAALSSVLPAQTPGAAAPPAVTVSAPTAVPVTSTVALPTNWTGVTATYNNSSGKAGGSFAYAGLISAKAQLYQYWAYDEAVVKDSTGKYLVVSTPRAGFAVVLKAFGPFYILGYANGGTATTGDNTGGVIAPGGLVILKLGSTDWTLHGDVRYVKNTLPSLPDQQVYGFGVGRIW